MKKINEFTLHNKVKNLNLSTPNNNSKVYNAIDDIIAASKRPKNPVHKGLIDLTVISIQPNSVLIESDEIVGVCSASWKQSLGKILANKYDLGQYCYFNPISKKRHLFK